jgi:hypothetical protein
MDPHGCILSFLDWSRYYFFQVAPQLYSRGWVDPVPDPLLLRKSGNRTRVLWICSQELWPLNHRCGRSPTCSLYKLTHNPDKSNYNEWKIAFWDILNWMCLAHCIIMYLCTWHPCTNGALWTYTSQSSLLVAHGNDVSGDSSWLPLADSGTIPFWHVGLVYAPPVFPLALLTA